MKLTFNNEIELVIQPNPRLPAVREAVLASERAQWLAPAIFTETGCIFAARTIRQLLQFLSLAAILTPPSAMALESSSETWATFRFLAPLGENSNWSMRYRERFDQAFEERILYQYQLALSHRLANGMDIGVGYELFRTSFGISENRLFPQLQFRSGLGGIPLRHRVRLELRDLTQQEIGFRDDLAYRFRYLLAYRRPVLTGAAYLELRNELFLTIGEGSALDPRLTQNRIGATFGHPLGKRFTAEFRYQYGFSRSEELTRGDHLFQLQLNWDLR